MDSEAVKGARIAAAMARERLVELLRLAADRPLSDFDRLECERYRRAVEWFEGRARAWGGGA